MTKLKKILKIFIGIGVLILTLVVFVFAMRAHNLETGKLHDWRAASLERRAAAVNILTASEDHTELVVACVDRMATLPDSGEMVVRDAVALCHTGILLKTND